MTDQRIKGAPKVFIASTIEDLGPYPDAAARAARRAGFFAVLSEDWEAKDMPPLPECLTRACWYEAMAYAAG